MLPVTAVTGAARCGTTLVMRMLDAGGVPAYADNRVSFETDKILRLPTDSAWLRECRGKAVKLLEPLYLAPLPSIDWRFILLSRDPEEQAKSHLKFLRMVSGLDVSDTEIPKLAASLRKDYPKMHKMLIRSGPVLTLRFEDVLSKPHSTALTIEGFLDRRLDISAMAACVVPRGPACLDYLLETSLVATEGQASDSSAVSLPL